jgi:FixJ family two-component response regulator
MASTPPGTVHVVDDDPSTLKSVVRLLRVEGIEAWPWSSPAEFLAGSGAIEAPACLLLDLKMPEMDGLALQEELLRRGFDLPIVFLTAHGEVPASVRALKAGALDFLLKPFVPEQLLAVVRHALARSADSRTAAADLRVLRTRHASLTPRERQVFDLVVRGHANREISTELGAAEKTIKVHRARVMTKMGAESLAGLVQQAILLGLLSPSASVAGPGQAPPGAPGRSGS